jgi:predicted ArsR family transcriptional regulator
MNNNPSKVDKPLQQTKGEKIMTLLQRKTGASVDELAKATDWQPHSVRGFLSGTLKKKLGLEVANKREEGKPCKYFIVRGAK